MNGRTAQHIVLAFLKYKCVQHARARVLSLHQMTQPKQISCSLRNVRNVILDLVNYNELTISIWDNGFHRLIYIFITQLKLYLYFIVILGSIHLLIYICLSQNYLLVIIIGRFILEYAYQKYILCPSINKFLIPYAHLLCS